MLHGAVENGGLGRAPLVLQRIGQFVSDQSVTRHEQERVASHVPAPRRALRARETRSGAGAPDPAQKSSSSSISDPGLAWSP